MHQQHDVTFRDTTQPQWHYRAASLAAVGTGIRPRPDWSVDDYVERLTDAVPNLASQMGGTGNLACAIRHVFATASLLCEERVELGGTRAELKHYAKACMVRFREGETLEQWSGRLAFERPWVSGLAAQFVTLSRCHQSYDELVAALRTQVIQLWLMLANCLLLIVALVMEGPSVLGGAIACVTVGFGLGARAALRRFAANDAYFELRYISILPALPPRVASGAQSRLLADLLATRSSSRGR